METDEFKDKLEQELATITAELDQIAVKNEQTGDWVAIPVAEDIGNADQNVEADTTEEWNVRRALMAQLEIRYLNVKRALDKIENNTFGICEISGEKIEEERLLANPAARTNLANIDRERELTI